MQTSIVSTRLTRRQIRALRFGHSLPDEQEAKIEAIRARRKAEELKRKVEELKEKSRDSIPWDPVIGRTLWNVGLFGPEFDLVPIEQGGSGFDFKRIILALGRPVLDYRY